MGFTEILQRLRDMMNETDFSSLTGNQTSNTSGTDMDNASYEKLLHEANYNKIIELLPVTVVMASLGVIGIVGNAVTIKFYKSKRRKTPTILLIISLAIVDLVVCLLFAPNIVEMCLNVLYTNAPACKFMHFLGHWFVESSGLILGFIAFDRYWKICGSTRRKISKKVAKRFVGFIVSFSCVMSIPTLINFDIVKVKLGKFDNSTSLTGHYCTNSDEAGLQLSVLIFNIADALTFIVILLVIVFTYSNILWTLYKVDELRRKNDNSKPGKCSDAKHVDTKAPPQTGTDVELRSSETKQVTLPPDQQIEEDANTGISVQDINSTIPRKKRARKTKKKIRKSEKNVTLLMLAVSTAFFLCAAPYFIVKLGIRSVKRSSDLELGLLIQFCLRLGYINSVLNPLIYCLFNPSFRRHMKRILMCKDKEASDSMFYVTSATSEWSTAPSRYYDDRVK